MPLVRWLLPLLLIGAFSASWASGEASEGPAWPSLTPAQREFLAPLAADWPKMAPNRKAKWLEIAGRYPSMPEEGKRRMQQRMAEWARMSPEERGQARSNFQETRRLSHQERRDQWEAYQALPKESKQALAARAAQPYSQASGDAKRPPPLDAQAPKSNIVNPASKVAPPRAVAPAVVQTGPGVTTSLVATPSRPPSHLLTGKPKIDVSPATVNRNTLLPKPGQAKAAMPATSAPAVSR